MGEQVGVVSAVGGREADEGGPDDAAGLRQVAERGRPGRGQVVRGGQEPAGGGLPRGGVAAVEQQPEGVGEPLLEAGVRAAVGEVEVAEQLARVGLAAQVVVDAVHPRPVPGWR